MVKKTIPTVVLGGSGYVAGEILRILMNHPHFRIDSVVSSSHCGSRIDDIFPHLTGPAGDLVFEPTEEALPLIQGKRQVAVFSALPHGETAPILQRLLGSGTEAKVVDMSADFRYRSSEAYQAVYGKPHPTPDMISAFDCVLPDLSSATPEKFLSHPGCFTTGVVLGLAPLMGLIEPNVSVSAITGSTGAGQQPGAGTHHPHRQSSMWAYQPLTHRHVPEMKTLLGAEDLSIAFVPHSGPFARGIHVTMFARLKPGVSEDQVQTAYDKMYANSPFVKASGRMPTVKEIVGSNRCHIGLAVADGQIVVTSVIDNLVKGAAGGAVQWMNRLFALDETEGLTHAVHGWI